MSDLLPTEIHMPGGTSSVPTPEGQYPTIHEAMQRVMNDVQSIAKADRNQQQNFSFRGIDAVMQAFGPAFREHGITCVPCRVEHGSETYTTSKGTQMRDVTVTVGYRFYGPAGDSIEAEVAGEAADAGDKATPKAMSVAFRTLLLQAFCVPTGDPDPDASSHERAPTADVRREDRPEPPIPRSWADIERAITKADNPLEAWALFEAFTRAACYYTFGTIDTSSLKKDEKDILFQHAGGATVWLQQNVPYDGPFLFFTEEWQRKAWAARLGGTMLEIPDYEPPEPPAPDPPDLDAEAELEASAADEADPPY